jgi:MoxR-like ATPase
VSDATQPPGWWIYLGTAQAHHPMFPPPPPWRSFTGKVPDDQAGDLPAAGTGTPDAAAAESRRLGRRHRATAYQADKNEIDLVNLALHLRRPLLVTGLPGVGKSTLAYSVSHELELGPVLHWPITSRSTLRDGLYQYDAVGRLQAVSLQREAAAAARRGNDGATADQAAADVTSDPLGIGQYIRLGPLGTALLPSRRPRVLLIDEVDKSDIDLPNDLLNIFEEGEFVIPELARLKQEEVRVMTADAGGSATLKDGLVRCAEFPFVVLTSNAERDFPMAFLRRCIRLEIPPPSPAKLARLVAAHLDPLDGQAGSEREELIQRFIKMQTEGKTLASDQLLNALLMASRGLWDGEGGNRLIDSHLLRPLGET